MELFRDWRRIGVAILTVALAVWFHRKNETKRRRKRMGLIEAVDRHKLSVRDAELLKDAKQGRATRKVCLGWIESGILRIARDRAGAMKVMVVMRLSGPRKLPKHHVEKALKFLQNRHPALRSLLQREKDRDAFYFEEQLDPAKRDPVPVFWSDRGAGGDSAYLEVWERESRKPPPNNESAINLFVLEDDQASDVVFVMDHFFCDGLSVVNLLKELMTLVTAYEAAEEENTQVDETALVGGPLKWQEPMEAAIAASFPNAAVQWGRVIKYIFTHLAFEPKMVDFPVADKSVTAADLFKKCVCNPYRATIPKDVVKPVLKACKSGGITMGSAIAAATLYAVRDLVANSPDRDSMIKEGRDLAVPLALDMRRRYSDTMSQEHLGYNISSNKAYKYNFGKSLKEGPVTKEIMLKRGRKMGEWYQEFDYAGLTFGTLLGPFFEQPPSFDHMSSLAITNWGRLDFGESFGDFKVKELFGMPNNPHFRMPTTVASTLNGALTLSIVVTEPVVTAASAKEYLALVEKNLRIFASID